MDKLRSHWVEARDEGKVAECNGNVPVQTGMLNPITNKKRLVVDG